MSGLTVLYNTFKLFILIKYYINYQSQWKRIRLYLLMDRILK